MREIEKVQNLKVGESRWAERSHLTSKTQDRSLLCQTDSLTAHAESAKGHKYVHPEIHPGETDRDRH